MQEIDCVEVFEPSFLDKLKGCIGWRQQSQKKTRRNSHLMHSRLRRKSSQKQNLVQRKKIDVPILPGKMETAMNYLEYACREKKLDNVRVTELFTRRVPDKYIDNLQKHLVSKNPLEVIKPELIYGAARYIRIHMDNFPTPLIPKKVLALPEFSLIKPIICSFITEAHFNRIKKVFRLLNVVARACAEEEHISKSVDRLARSLEMGLTGTKGNKLALKVVRHFILDYKKYFTLRRGSRAA